MESTSVRFQSLSWGTSLITVIAGNRYSLQVVCLDVTFYNFIESFFATHFAHVWYFMPWRPISVFASWDHVKKFLHHRLDLLSECLEVSAWLTLDCYSCRSLFKNLFFGFVTCLEACWFLKQMIGLVRLSWVFRTQCQIVCTMRFQRVSKILTPRRMLQKTWLIA